MESQERLTPPHISDVTTQALKDFVAKPMNGGYKVGDVQTYEAEVRSVDEEPPTYQHRSTVPNPRPAVSVPPRQERVQVPRTTPTTAPPIPTPVTSPAPAKPSQEQPIDQDVVLQTPNRLNGAIDWVLGLLKKEKEVEQQQPTQTQSPKKTPKQKKEDNSTAASTPIHLDVPFYFLVLCGTAKLLKLLTFIPGAGILLELHTWIYIALGIGFASLYKPKWKWLRHLWFLVIAYGLFFVLR